MTVVGGTQRSLRTDLARIVGDDFALIGDAQSGRFGHDMSERSNLRGRADAVVLPRDEDEVAQVVAWSYRRGVPLIPRGGGTGYAGGATALDGGVVVALERLRSVHAFDPLLWRLRVGAGTTTATVQRLTRENGLYFPVDPGAAEQSQIGGNVATNAGGPHCFKYGTTRAWVTGLTAVLPPGEIASFGGPLRKDVAGYDMIGLLTGSEGTLGIVTDVWLRLIPRPERAVPVSAVFPNAREGVAAIEAVLASGVVPAALEYLDGETFKAAGSGFPGSVSDPGFLVIADVDSGPEDAASLREALGPGSFSPDPESLWRWRDGVSHVITGIRGRKISEDVAVPIDRLAEAVDRTLDIGAQYGIPGCSWGHAGDGNLHSTFMFSPTQPDEARRAYAAGQAILEMAIELGGTISGEHGIGVLKNGFLRQQWNRAATNAHLAVKATFDPKNLLNPGKKLP
jgi:FAD/FMN-containing dehydrogenase